MIKIFLSKDINLARLELLKEIGKSKIKPVSFSIEENSWKNYLESNSLFGDKVELVFDNDDASDFSKENLEAFSKSKNTVFLFGKETVVFVKVLEKIKAEIFNVKEKKEFVQKETPPVFKITNAISVGDKKKAWLSFLEARDVEPAESIHGGLLWFFKNLYLYERGLEERFAHGLSPYVASGVKNAIVKIGKERIKNLYKEITFLLSNSRFKGTDANIEIENFILKKIFK